MKLRSLFIADSVASEVSRIRAAAEAQAVRRGRIRVPAGASAWLMRVTRTLIPFLVLCLMLGMTGCDLNLLGQTRFTVDGQVYGLETTECGSSVTIGLERVGGPTQESDAETISQVSGIVIVNPEGASVGVAEVTYDPYGWENGLVLISFETGGQSGPWTLMWPDHDPVLNLCPVETMPPTEEPEKKKRGQIFILNK